MKSSKLLKSIESLNLAQRRDLDVFAGMPSNRLSSRDQELLRTLVKSKKQNAALSEDHLWENLLNEGERVNRNRIKNRLLKTVERYIGLYQLDVETNFKNVLVSKYYIEQQIERNAVAAINKGIGYIHKDENQNPNTNIFLYWLHEMGVQKDREKRTVDQKLQFMEDALQDFYSETKIRLICEKANRNKIINGHKDYKDYLYEVEALKEKSHSVYTQAQYWAFKLVTEQKETYYEKLNRYLFTQKEKLGEQYQREIRESLMNFCIRRINAGHFQYAAQYLIYIEELEATQSLLNEGTLSIGRLKNCVLAGLLLDRTDWALDFLNKYTAKLSLSDAVSKGPFLEFNRAVIELQRKNLKKSFQHISNFQKSDMYLKDVYYKIACDKLLFKLYYEENEKEAILNKIENTKDFVRSQKKLSDRRKQFHLVFLKVLQQLAKNKEVKLEKVKGEILIPDYLWLSKVVRGRGRLKV